MFVTSSSFTPTAAGSQTDEGLQTSYSRYAVAALQNTTTDFLTLGRMSWDNQGALQAVVLSGTNGAILHLIPAELPNGDVHFAFDLQARFEAWP